MLYPTLPIKTHRFKKRFIPAMHLAVLDSKLQKNTTHNH